MSLFFQVLLYRLLCGVEQSLCEADRVISGIGGVSSYVRQAVLQVADLATQAMTTPEPLPSVSRSKKPVIKQTIGYEDVLFVTYTKTKTGELKRRHPGRAKILVVEQGHRRFLASRDRRRTQDAGSSKEVEVLQSLMIRFKDKSFV
ncbi:hypothetical protein BSKO_02670 [Bryopsis sp. KO-2023]|nr:hypothetical protein BSKO_02670 [Bryopsis sp. KO-2023]